MKTIRGGGSSVLLLKTSASAAVDGAGSGLLALNRRCIGSGSPDRVKPSAHRFGMLGPLIERPDVGTRQILETEIKMSDIIACGMSDIDLRGGMVLPLNAVRLLCEDEAEHEGSGPFKARA